MNARYAICLVVGMVILSMGSTGYCGSDQNKADICDPEIISKIQQAKSSKEDVHQLIGQPKKVEALRNDEEVWKYTSSEAAFKGSGRQSTFSTSGKSRGSIGGSSSFSTRMKKCHVHVVFDKNGIVKKVRKSKTSGGN